MSFRNQAAWDRALRLALGLIALGLGWFGPVSDPWAMALQLGGLYPLLTGMFGWDPVYSLLGISTHRD